MDDKLRKKSNGTSDFTFCIHLSQYIFVKKNFLFPALLCSIALTYIKNSRVEIEVTL
jgi:hypothetical protein